MRDFKKEVKKKLAIKRRTNKSMVNELFVKTGQFDKLKENLKHRKHMYSDKKIFNK